ncbi:MAG: ABC-three component system protein [Maribacter sp.]|uniref:ABC-three component system protein n=1 Tax=Maribacter sp. TaxID=1897614 RepID=UPI0032977D19
MKDSAKGPSSGYIFQFEIALLELSKLKKLESISIEKIDDIAKEDENGTYTLTAQAKHSISLSGKTFGNTSEDLWKTINIWVDKIRLNILTEKNKFKAITNVGIPNNSIIRKFTSNSFAENIGQIKRLRHKQQLKVDEKIERGEAAPSISKTISLIDYALEHSDELEIIFENFSYEEHYEIKDDFFNAILIGNVEDDTLKESFYQSFYGWIIQKSKEMWLHQKEAVFTRKDFEDKYNHIRDNHTIVNASSMFRNRKTLEAIQSIDTGVNRSELFIRQLSDIERDQEDKEDIIREAIIDFILCDIEIAYFIKHNKSFTKVDFEDFEDLCIKKWKEVKRKHISQNIANYSLEQLNDFSIKICDEVLTEVKLSFHNSFGFDDSNKYIQNGTFLNLTNIPKIGWHPDWKKKYSK